MTAPTALFLSWQNPTTRQWFVVGKLSRTAAGFAFAYTWGADAALEAGFSPLAEFPDLDGGYESEELFATFASRLPPPSRPDYADFVEWLGLPASEATPLLLLERSNGTRQTDSFELFRAPEPNGDGTLTAAFFLRGLRHRDEAVQRAGAALTQGARLFMSLDFQNVRDPQAISLQDQESIFVFGHVPRYLTPLVHSLRVRGGDTLRVTVERVNPPPAPAQLRVLCRFEARSIPRGLPLFTEAQYRPRVNTEPA